MMNALAQKYLPIDQQISHFNSPAHVMHTRPVNVEANNSNMAKDRNADMSMTSYRYMEKYGLL